MIMTIDKTWLARTMLIANQKTNELMADLSAQNMETRAIHQTIYDAINNLAIAIELLKEAGVIDKYMQAVEYTIDHGGEVQAFLLDQARQQVETDRKAN